MTTTLEELHDEILTTGDGDGVGMRYRHVAQFYPYALPENAREWDSIREIQRAVTASGSHFYDRGAVRTFRGRTDDELHGRRFWVESRRYVPGPFSSDTATYAREYMVAWAYDAPTSDMIQIERIGNFPSLRAARRACARLAAAI